MAGERGLKAARSATVQICESSGRALGRGLLLALDGEGCTVLTCHHVVAETDPANLRVRRGGSAGGLEEAVPARLDEAASRPERDAVVLRVDAPWKVRNPLLHAIDWFRAGFFEVYRPHWLDRSYVAVVAIVSLLVGLALHCLLRRKLSAAL